MTKFTILSIYAALATLFCIVHAQQATPTLPSGISIPEGLLSEIPSGAIPTDIASMINSLIHNPSAVKSYISIASKQVSLLPTQYQASAYSDLAAASNELNSLNQAKPTGSTNQTSAGNHYVICNYSFITMFVITAVMMISFM
ncbi:uncharacterized protein BX663DRAFT_500151 [Cokeromyces recurvatus]|uniref:uncharacterized protein n=1 Tax=Cokeromyces recurvatus TaxID=90255 RepID=UPI00221E7A50|nr:uncharacterized protein BX663DRAFT_500151 [Cokeromyces recurvatus]KAI7905563.1 hypothetical protein BX663DRAFT_500151 [Cokeromyces recurvatus]